MTPLFADAFYYWALLNAEDEAHERAVELTSVFDGMILTTDWILMELADGLADSNNRKAFLDLYDGLRTDPQVEIVDCDRDLFAEGLKLYRARPDKGWPLTDCISFVVMQHRGITEALTADRHFEQAGFAALLK